MPTVNDTLIEIRDILSGIRSDMSAIGDALYTELTGINSGIGAQGAAIISRLDALNTTTGNIYNDTGAIAAGVDATVAAIQALELTSTNNTSIVVETALASSCPCPDEFTQQPLPPGSTNCIAKLVPYTPATEVFEASVGDYFETTSGGSSSSEFVLSLDGVEVWRTDVVSGETFDVTVEGIYTATIEGSDIGAQPLSLCSREGAQEASDKCQRAQAAVDGFREILRIMRTYRAGTVLTKSLINDAWSYAIALWGDRKNNAPPLDNVQAMISAWTTGRTGWDWQLLTVLDLARDAAVLAIYNASTPEQAAIDLGAAIYAEGSIDPRYDAFVASMFDMDVLNKVFTLNYDGFAVGGYSPTFCDPL